MQLMRIVPAVSNQSETEQNPVQRIYNHKKKKKRAPLT